MIWLVGAFNFCSETAVKAKYTKEHFTSKIHTLIHRIIKNKTPDRLDLILQALYIRLEKFCLTKSKINHKSVTTCIFSIVIHKRSPN